jgi:hypothetical protein
MDTNKRRALCPRDIKPRFKSFEDARETASLLKYCGKRISMEWNTEEDDQRRDEQIGCDYGSFGCIVHTMQTMESNE